MKQALNYIFDILINLVLVNFGCLYISEILSIFLGTKTSGVIVKMLAVIVFILIFLIIRYFFLKRRGASCEAFTKPEHRLYLINGFGLLGGILAALADMPRLAVYIIRAAFFVSLVSSSIILGDFWRYASKIEGKTKDYLNPAKWLILILICGIMSIAMTVPYRRTLSNAIYWGISVMAVIDIVASYDILIDYWLYGISKDEI